MMWLLVDFPALLEVEPYIPKLPLYLPSSYLYLNNLPPTSDTCISFICT
jgi:hypothetical protein